MFTISQQVKLNELDKACRVSFAYWYKTRTYEAEINYMYWVQEKANFMHRIIEKYVALEENCLFTPAIQDNEEIY